MAIQLKSKEYYNTNKKIFNAYYNVKWKNISYPIYIGDCSYLYNKIKPKDYQDFLEKYIGLSDKNNFNYETLEGDDKCGRNESQLMALAEFYCKECNNPLITVDQCLDDIINHIIIETFDGHTIERHITQLIESTGKFKVTGTFGYLDIKCGVDLVVLNKETNKIAHLIQIKPITCFIGNNNVSLKIDRATFYKKQKSIEKYLTSLNREDEIHEIEFMCYNRNDYLKNGRFNFLISPKGNTRFRLSELCDTNGNSKILLKNCRYREI